MFTYEFTSKSLRQLLKLPKNTQLRILEKLDYYCQYNVLFYAERLKDYKLGEYRLRIGNYRVIFDVVGEKMVIHKIGHRRAVYR